MNRLSGILIIRIFIKNPDIFSPRIISSFFLIRSIDGNGSRNYSRGLDFELTILRRSNYIPSYPSHASDQHFFTRHFAPRTNEEKLLQKSSRVIPIGFQWLRIIQLRGNIVSRISLGNLRKDNFLCTIFTMTGHC